VQALDDSLQQPVDAVRPRDLQQRAQDLRAAQRGAGRGQRGGVEEVDEGLDGEVGVGEIEGAGAEGGRGSAGVRGVEGRAGGGGGGGGGGVGVVCEGGRGGEGRFYGRRDGDAGVARGLRDGRRTQRRRVEALVQRRAAGFAQELVEVGSPAPRDQVRVYGDPLAA